MNTEGIIEESKETIEFNVRESSCFSKISDLGLYLVDDNTSISTLKHQQIMMILAFLCEMYHPGIEGTSYKNVTFSKQHREELNHRLTYLGIQHLFPETASAFKDRSLLLPLFEALLSMIDRSKGPSKATDTQKATTPRPKSSFDSQTSAWKNRIAEKESKDKLKTPQKQTPKKSVLDKVMENSPLRSSPRLRALRSPKVHAVESPQITPVKKSNKSIYEKINDPFASRSLIPRSPSSGTANRRSSLVQKKFVEELSPEVSVDANVSVDNAETEEVSSPVKKDVPVKKVESPVKTHITQDDDADVQDIVDLLDQQSIDVRDEDPVEPNVMETRLQEGEPDTFENSVTRQITEEIQAEGFTPFRDDVMMEERTIDVSAKFNFDPVKVSKLRRSEVETILKRVHGFIHIWKNQSNLETRYD